MAAAAKKKVRTTTVKVPAPKAGDVSFAVVQVRMGKKGKAPAAKGRKAYKGRVGGVALDVRSKAWKKLRKTTKVHVVSTGVAGKSSSLRNVGLFIVRRKGGKADRAKGSFTFSIANAAAEKGAWVNRKISRKGKATVYSSRNALTTAVGNWERYLGVLTMARAVKAAMNPTDVNGTFARRPQAKASAVKISRGGHRMSSLTRQAFELIFGTMDDTLKHQAAKKSPVAAQFIAKELKNPQLSKRWTAIVAKLPLKVPDAYAANAKEEAKFAKIKAPVVSSAQVTIEDELNFGQAMNAEIAANRTFSQNLTVGKSGSGTGVVTSEEPGINCGSTCVHEYLAGERVVLVATAAPGSEFKGWTGCDGRGGNQCVVNIGATTSNTIRELNAKFERSTPQPPPGTSSGQTLTFGADLSRQANAFESHQQDSVFWNTVQPGGGSPTSPLTGQVLEIRLKGNVIPAENGRLPGDDGDLRVQVLKPQSDGVMRVPDGGGTSAPFKIPVGGSHDVVTVFRPENLCIARGDSVAINTKGGWDGTNLGAGGYHDGIPFQIFSSTAGAANNQFHKHDGTNNGARLENGVDDAYEPRATPVTRQDQELLLSVTVGTGSSAVFLCPGGTHNPYRP